MHILCGLLSIINKLQYKQYVKNIMFKKNPKTIQLMHHFQQDYIIFILKTPLYKSVHYIQQKHIFQINISKFNRTV